MKTKSNDLFGIPGLMHDYFVLTLNRCGIFYLNIASISSNTSIQTVFYKTGQRHHS
jgi:hypothetical protein